MAANLTGLRNRNVQDSTSILLASLVFGKLAEAEWIHYQRFVTHLPGGKVPSKSGLISGKARNQAKAIRGFEGKGEDHPSTSTSHVAIVESTVVVAVPVVVRKLCAGWLVGGS